MTDDEADELYAPALWPYSATPVVGPPMEHWGNRLSPIWEGNSEPTNLYQDRNVDFLTNLVKLGGPSKPRTPLVIHE